jgi:hypothetical protein
LMSELGLPRELGTSLTQTSTNIFGGDGLFRKHTNDLLPLAGGAWGSGATAGVFAVVLFAGSGNSTDGSFGARAVRLLAA